MKKILVALISVLIACISLPFAACGTVYDDLEVLKIVTEWHEGMSRFGEAYTREFDFVEGSVTDTIVVKEEYLQTEIDYYKEYPEQFPEYYESVEQFEEELYERYNNPKTVTEFTEEQGNQLLKSITKLGFYTWKDRYETNKIIMDGGSAQVKVYFTDGTVKSTYIYYKNPKNYNKIMKAFENNLGVTFYLSW